MMRLGEGMSVKEIDEIITDADPLGEGVINMQNFVQLMKDTQQGAMA
jgi:Ca2+-binding EF-hand superfamily protein